MNHESPADLWRVQLALECKKFTARGTLVEIPCPNPDGLATGHLVRYADGRTELVFADSAPGWFIDRARRIDVARYLSDADAVARELGEGDAQVATARYSTYVFRPPVAAVEGSATIRHEAPETATAVVDGRRVAEASSSRSNDEAAELWVRTEPEHRRRGYARQVAASWARVITDTGKIAFYSHLADNHVSRSLAVQLDVIPLFDLVGMSLAR